MVGVPYRLWSQRKCPTGFGPNGSAPKCPPCRTPVLTRCGRRSSSLRNGALRGPCWTRNRRCRPSNSQAGNPTTAPTALNCTHHHPSSSHLPPTHLGGPVLALPVLALVLTAPSHSNHGPFSLTHPAVRSPDCHLFLPSFPARWHKHDPRPISLLLSHSSNRSLTLSSRSQHPPREHNVAIPAPCAEQPEQQHAAT